MNKQAADFLKRSAAKAPDLAHRRKINFNMGKYHAAVPLGKQQFADLEKARQAAKQIKWSAIEQLDVHLELFERRITARGAKVIWAADVQEAQEAIGKICRDRQCRTVVKSKSMVTEEIHVNQYLQSIGIESIETDLGEYIQQLDGEPPYHIVTPAMHKNRDDIARVFEQKLGTPAGLTPQQMTMVARENLRRKFAEAEVGISGANFIVADTGSICITENEGNARLSCSLPKTHIVVVGIEKVIPSLQQLSLFWPLLATHGTGQWVTVYNTLISGPRQADETDGPEEMFVILLDNGRTNLLAHPPAREALYCIRCGACLNACPVYKNIGGHAYSTTYSGPIGKVISPYLSGFEGYRHLSYASSLCGNCTEVCPVKINLHELLLDNRKEAVTAGLNGLTEQVAWKAWRVASLHRRLMNAAGGSVKNKVVNSLFKGWKAHRADLQFSQKTFNQLWKEQQAKQHP
jgi:L-lactate dehydrogenase complex protein LldF